jgi:hypothetical protein
VESIPSLAADLLLRWFSASAWMLKDVITDLYRSTIQAPQEIREQET